MVGNLRKRKVEYSKRSSEKNGKNEKKNEEWKEVEVQFEHYCEKLVELILFEKKEKLCFPLVFRNYFVPYISFLHS